MERPRIVAICIFILSLSLLSFFAQTSFALEQPATTATLAFLIAGLSLLISGRVASSVFNHVEPDNRDVSIPLAGSQSRTSSDSDTLQVEKLGDGSNSTSQRMFPALGLGPCLLALRVEIWRHLMKSTECATSIGAFLPLLLVALYDYRSHKRRKSGDPPHGKESASAALFSHFLPPSLLVAAGFASSRLTESRRSTVICPLFGDRSTVTLVLQVLGACLDGLLFISFSILGNSEPRSDRRVVKRTTLWAFPFLTAAAIWVLVGLVLLAHPFGLPAWTPTFPSHYFSSALRESSLFAIMILSACKAVSSVRALTLPVIMSLIAVYMSLLSSILVTVYDSITIPTSITVVSITLLHASGYWYFRQSASAHSDRKRKLPSWSSPHWIALLSFGSLFLLTFAQRPETPHHPIYLLINNAQANHQYWLSHARRSKTLDAAVVEYRRRYNQRPPPGFDVWYEYATNRSSVIIDDFDQIYHDLLPFRAMSPKELRDTTVGMTTDPYNDIAAVIVRNGVAELQPDILPTHRWMVEGVVELIKPFVAYLPDMDIAFNLNDECRVAVPWKDIQALNRAGKNFLPPDPELTSQWPSDRAASWPKAGPSEQNPQRKFMGLPSESVFDQVARPLCSPSSNTGKWNVWDRRSLCTSCSRAHSRGQFVRDWDLSSDHCHQPDLAFHHGFYLAPASLKVSQSLLPVFSQSKVSGFNDILYPSAWNYVDKVKYDPSDEHPDAPYLEKEPSIFWRGATSEGLSGNGAWKGMTRQRLVHLANNHTSNLVTVLLPSAPGSRKYTYQSFPASSLESALNLTTSIHLAEEIVRCGGPDCTAQTAEFGLATRTDFQMHWSYRFLFDMDGAGFSGRFLPFLQSRSLPFRTALFRQWFDSRLTPWLHFVPQDLRLHDVFSTLAYFAGAATVGPGGKTKVLMAPHDRQGELIAEEGRKWANTALRKEDMEIYMFRLLIEWGRLTDDRRDDLGFSL